ncbi:MAG: hypothetical protein R3255_10960 [Candidatus Lokiarchaeia archaeon]|nr:hypothetical protein [Candidatus Lokiarchaeia archaeon]
MSGLGIKESIFLNKPMKLIDVSPTLSEILEIPKPLNSQGGIVNENYD